MNRKNNIRATTAAMLTAGLMATALSGAAIANPCNPCAPRNQAATSANPCAAKNPCAARNPCAAANPGGAKIISRPANYTPYKGNQAQLIKLGEKLFNDKKLSTNGMACATCHQSYGAYNESFSHPYPHKVSMASENYGVGAINLDEAVQMCMIGPMEAKPLGWKSKELTALVAYVGSLQKGFKPAAGLANPCAAKNPCAARNPCAAKNPCAA